MTTADLLAAAALFVVSELWLTHATLQVPLENSGETQIGHFCNLIGLLRTQDASVRLPLPISVPSLTILTVAAGLIRR